LPIQNAASSNSSFQHFKRNHKNGNFYLAGVYESSSGSLSIGGSPINAANNVFIMYVAAFDAAGNSLWVKQSSNDRTCSIYNLSVSRDDILYILAAGAKNTVFNGDTLIHGPSANTTSGWNRYVLLSMDSSGNNLWRVEANDTVSFGTDFFRIN